MAIKFENGRIYNSEKREFEKRDLYIEDGMITSGGNADEVVDLGGKYVVPGLVDIHTHGRAGGDFGSADSEMLDRMAAAYLESGVTTVMPTLASAPYQELFAARDRINSAKKRHTGAYFAGIHIEGRYLNLKKRGAHAPELLAPLDPKELDQLMPGIDGAIHLTAAFELDPDGKFAECAKSHGATLGIGHTMATYAEAKTAEARGVTSYTHLFNAMPPLHHRDGGAVCAALTGDKFAELICDGFHVCGEMVKLAYECKKENLVLITDSMEATGCRDGEYTIAGMPVTVTDGKAWTHDGAIAGSTLNLFDGVKNLMSFAGITFDKAIYNATAAPAKEVGIFDCVGSLDTGKSADFLVVDKDLEMREVWHRGVRRTVK